MTQVEANNEGMKSNSVPSSLAQVGITMKYTFLDYFRSRRFYIMLGIAVLIGGALSGVVGYYKPAGLVGSGSSPLGLYSGWWSLVTTFVIVLSGIFFGGDAISGEFHNKTGYFIAPNPIRRSSIYIGKWLSAFSASSLILALSAVIVILNQIYYFGWTFPYQFGEALIFSWIYLAAVLGFTFFFSSLFKSSSTSILVSVILLLFGFSIIETLVSTFAKTEPWFLLSYGSGIIGNILTTPYPQHVSTISAGPRFSLTSYAATVPEGLAILFAYFIITAILGLLLFERKEFN
jgi:ABC-2 type transport system permease protein